MRSLVVEDEPKAGEYLRKGLSESGFVVDWASNGLEGLHLALEQAYDVIVLDVMLPDMDGWQLVRELRLQRDTPVLFLTARDELADRIKGLELGADDYLVEPFAFAELVIRIRTLLRRGPLRESERIDISDMEIDVLRRRVCAAAVLPASGDVATLCGALLAGILAYGIVRRGLQPLHALAHQAQGITAQHLELRLDAASAPHEMQTLIAAFNAMLDRLHQSFHRLSQFSADLAHDLRTPINNLMLQSQVALSQLRSVDDYQTLLASNLEEYERLARMLENMLFLARADHAQVALARQALDAQCELQRIADYFEGLADEAGVLLTVQASGSVMADPILLRRAANNLVANAIRYTPRGATIVLHAARLGLHDVIDISNPGSGIRAEDLPRLFDRFYRADQARSDSASSAGLGLAIVQSIMLLQGGTAQIDSVANGVTRFRLAFPCSAATA